LRSSYKNLLGVAISIGFVVFLLYKIDFRSVISVLKSFDVIILYSLFGIYIISFAIRTVRWKFLIKIRENLPVGIVFKSLAIGYMINNLLPAKVGELARMEYLKRKCGLGRSFLLGTIFTERLLDVLMVLTMLIVSVLLSETVRLIIQDKTWFFLFILLLLVVFVFFMYSGKGIEWFVKIAPTRLKSRFEQIILSFNSGIHFLKDRKLFGVVGVLTLLIWGLTLLANFLILYGLGITLSFYAYLFVVAAGVFGFVIPSTSGGIGVYHAIATSALLLFGVEPPVAMSFAIIAHAFDFFPAIHIGGVVVLYDNVKSKTKREKC
jgi:glycosyltransferase 2 family protein